MRKGMPKSVQSELKFKKPPIWEVGFAVITQTPGVVDPYDVRGLHKAVEDVLPHVERQAPINTFEGLTYLSTVNTGLGEGAGVPPRWWFIADNQQELLQAQERFWAWNWRANGNVDGPKNYPGFDQLRLRARDAFDRTRIAIKKQGMSLPDPAAVELMYDNVIPLSGPGLDELKLRDVLAEYEPSPPGAKSGWQMMWFEPIDGVPEEQGHCRVAILLAGIAVPNEQEIRPIVRFSFHAASLEQTWDAAFDFFDLAHAHITKRLIDLTTETARARWEPQ